RDQRRKGGSQPAFWQNSEAVAGQQCQPVPGRYPQRNPGTRRQVKILPPSHFRLTVSTMKICPGPVLPATQQDTEYEPFPATAHLDCLAGRRSRVLGVIALDCASRLNASVLG